MAAALGYVAARLDESGVDARLAVGAVWLIAALPPVSQTTVALWKDVPYTIAVVWLFAEFVHLGNDQDAAWFSPTTALRIGLALGLLTLFRHNGILPAAIVAVGIAIAYRRRLRQVLVVLATAVLLVVSMQLGVYRLADVDTTRLYVDPFISDVAVVFDQHPQAFTADQREYLTRIAPYEVWDDHTCDDVNRVSYHPAFNRGALLEDQSRFVRVALHAVASRPLTVAANHLCNASYLAIPRQPADAYLQRPPYAIPDNGLGIARQPLSGVAYRVTRHVFVWAESPSVLGVLWRPALPLLAAVAAFIVVGTRTQWRLLWPALLVGALVVNELLIVMAQEFRFVFPIYLTSLLSVPLATATDNSRPPPA